MDSPSVRVPKQASDRIVVERGYVCVLSKKNSSLKIVGYRRICKCREAVDGATSGYVGPTRVQGLACGAGLRVASVARLTSPGALWLAPKSSSFGSVIFGLRK